MKRTFLLAIAAAIFALAAAAAVFLQVSAPAAAPARSLAQITPSGALLYIEAKDFGALLKDWNTSPEKQSWLKSDDYQVFSRSKLFLRLKHDQAEFAKAAGFPPDMGMLDQVAGSESGFAIYDIGKLEFLYVTRTPQARAAESVLWQKRGDYQPRKVGSADYYVRVEPESQRTIAFAVSGDYLLLATREDLLAQSLSLLTSSSGKAVAGEGWYTKSVAAAGEHGDLRIVLNLEAIVATPQFNSYWIQENVPEIKARYSSEVTDLFRTADEYREQRVLLLKGDTQEKAGKSVANPELESAVGQLLRLVPANQSFYESWAKPSTDELMNAISTEILSPHFGPRPSSKMAPGAAGTSGTAGSEADLETRIDEPQPAPVKAGENPLKSLLTAAQPTAVLKVKNTRQTQDGVFVQPLAAVAIMATDPWNPDTVRDVLQRSLENITTSRLGATWVPRKPGATTYYELDGLRPLSVFSDKNLLVISNSPETMQALLGSITKPAASGAWYASAFEHGRESGNFIKMTRSIENTGVNTGLGRNPEHGNDSTRQPKFFSDNIGSLSQTLKRVQTESIVVHDLGDRETQTVRYKWVE
jgi:hypothetical protein